MNNLIATLHTLGMRLQDRHRGATERDNEAGMTTVEVVVITLALVLLAGVVFAFFNTYVRANSTSSPEHAYPTLTHPPRPAPRTTSPGRRTARVGELSS